MTGDLINAFDFENPDYSWPLLPDTSNYVKEAWIECVTLPDPVIPAEQFMPLQERGIRISRKLPYEFQISDKVKENIVNIQIVNTGESGAPFVLFDVINLSTAMPLKYAVEAAKEINYDLKIVEASGDYSFHLQGPNGFVRNFWGNSMDVSCQGIQSYVTYEPDQGSLVIYLSNEGSIDTYFEITDNVYESFLSQTTLVAQGSSSTISFDISNAGYWYDVSVSVSSCYLRRSMGRMETNKDSISDPAMSSGLPGLWSGVSNTAGVKIKYPTLPLSLRTIKREETKFASTDKDANFKYIDVEMMMSDYF
jgi:phospholipase C